MLRTIACVLVSLIAVPLMAQQAVTDTWVAGTVQPAAGNVPQGATDTHALSFGLARYGTGSDDTFTGLVVRNTAGSNPAQAGDFVRLRLWHDADANDSFDPAIDTPIAEASSASFPVTFGAFTAPQTIADGTAMGYFVTIDVSPNATVGRVFRLEVRASDVTTTSHNVSELTIPQGPNLTVEAGTTGGVDVLHITRQPGNGTAGNALSTQPRLELRDAQGNLRSTDNTTVVSVAITPGSGNSSATLGPPASLTVTASGGVAEFSGLTIDLAGTGYTLSFTAANHTGALSSAFNVTDSGSQPPPGPAPSGGGSSSSGGGCVGDSGTGPVWLLLVALAGLAFARRRLLARLT